MRRHVSVTSSWLPARIATCRVASDTHCHSTPSASDRCRPVCGTLAGGGKVRGGEGRRGRARGGGREGEEEGEREKGREGERERGRAGERESGRGERRREEEEDEKERGGMFIQQ